MRLTVCLLDENNFREIDGLSIARRVTAQGKRHLWDERSGAPVDTVVIHEVSAVNVDPARAHDPELIVRVFCDLGVSVHYLVDRHGDILSLVPEEGKAWHCGGSIMPPPDLRRAVNDFSVGIEFIASPGEHCTDEQYCAVNDLCGAIEERWQRQMIYVGHEDIAGAAAVRLGLRQSAKTDPGPQFDWSRLVGRHHLGAPALV